MAPSSPMRMNKVAFRSSFFRRNELAASYYIHPPTATRGKSTYARWLPAAYQPMQLEHTVTKQLMQEDSSPFSPSCLQLGKLRPMSIRLVVLLESALWGLAEQAFYIVSGAMSIHMHTYCTCQGAYGKGLT